MRSASPAAIAALACSFVLFTSASAAAQAGAAGHKRVLGYQDTQTGDFHPLANVAPDVTSSPAPTTGKYVITFDVTLESSFASGSEILCEVILNEVTLITTTTAPFETSSSYEEVATGTATAGAAGSKSTCVATLPYSWIIPAAPKGGTAKTTISASYIVSAYTFSGAGTTATASHGRSSGSALPIQSTLPKDDATTAATVPVTL